MKKYRGFLVMLLVCLLAFCGAALADTLEEDRQALRQAETFDAQLAILNKIATENAAELEMGGWENSYTIDAAPGIPEGLIPEDWDKLKFTEADSLPEAMRGHKFIALYCAGKSSPEFAGDILARMPADMRAASLEEAEYALIVRWHKVKSGIEYIIPATSYDRDYEAFAMDMKTGEYVRFWTKVNGAKSSGIISELDGDLFSQQELWTILRTYFLGELRHELADGSVLVFGITGENCYLKRAELAEGVTELVIPGKVEGYTVTELAAECLCGKEKFRSIVLPEGLKRISDRAFLCCKALESVTLPNTLESIGEEAFYMCSKLQKITFPDSLRTLGKLSFFCAHSLKSIVLPGTIETMEYGVFMDGDRLASVVVGEGIKSLPDNLFKWCNNVACYFFPSSLTGGLDNYMIVQSAVIYAPEGSYALTWAKENGYECVACPSPDAMPPVEFFIEGDFEFRTFRGEVALSAYLGSDAHVVVPESAGGVPVTCILPYSIYDLSHMESVTLPQSVRTVRYQAIGAYSGSVDVEPGFHLYVSNPETAFEKLAVDIYSSYEITFTIHAPEGSAAQRYVTEINSDQIVFEPWGEGIDPDARSVSDAVMMAGQVQQNVASFWQTCDQQEYAWLGRVLGYDMAKPEAAGVLRITQPQFDELALLLGGKDGVAAAFATIVNTQFSLPYAKAAARTAQSGQLAPVADGSCAIVALAYQTDIVLAVLQADGSAQAALICSTPKIIQMFSPEYIQKIAADFGITEGVCTVYKGEELSALLNR